MALCEIAITQRFTKNTQSSTKLIRLFPDIDIKQNIIFVLFLSDSYNILSATRNSPKAFSIVVKRLPLENKYLVEV